MNDALSVNDKICVAVYITIAFTIMIIFAMLISNKNDKVCHCRCIDRNEQWSEVSRQLEKI